KRRPEPDTAIVKPRGRRIDEKGGRGMEQRGGGAHAELAVAKDRGAEGDGPGHQRRLRVVAEREVLGPEPILRLVGIKPEPLGGDQDEADRGQHPDRDQDRGRVAGFGARFAHRRINAGSIQRIKQITLKLPAFRRRGRIIASGLRRAWISCRTQRDRRKAMRKLLVLAAGLMTAGMWASAHADTATYKATLNGASEVPPVTSSATGTATVNVDTASKKVSWNVTYTGLTPAAAHIHCGAAAGANAGVAVPLTAGPSPLTGSGTMTDAQLADLAAGKCYVNIHTAANKGGEIRGQLAK